MLQKCQNLLQKCIPLNSGFQIIEMIFVYIQPFIFSPIMKPADSSRACSRHEVAVPIARLVSQLDLKEENIVTLLSYLELHPTYSYVQVR